MLEGKKIVICEGIRTPIGHIAKSLSGMLPEVLLNHAVQGLLKKTGLNHDEVDGVMIGWVGQGSHAPNIARIVALESGLKIDTHALTVQCNCVSGMESISCAARNIMLDEGELYLAGGTESMSTMPYAIRGSRANKLLRSKEILQQNWDLIWGDTTIKVADCIEEGLRDPYEHINMAETAEVCAQKYKISREEQDDYTAETFKRCMKAQETGFYSTHVQPLEIDGTRLEKDEYVYLRKKLINDPEMIRNAPFLFNSADHPFREFWDNFGEFIGEPYNEEKHKPSVTLFNSCARSDAAAVLIVTTEEKAKKLGLKIMARLTSWAYKGFEPALMGVAPAFATQTALQRAGLKFDDMDDIELHEAFASTVLSAFKVGENKFGHKWKEKWEKGILNPNGSSMALGHPLAATGTRLILNLIYQMEKNKNIRFGLAAACAAGGIGGAIIVEKY